MIVRHTVLRRGHKLLKSHLHPTCLRRTSTVPGTGIESTAASLANSEKEMHSIDSFLNSLLPKDKPLITPVDGTDQDPKGILHKYHATNRLKRQTKHLGSTIAPHYEPHKLLSNPPGPNEVTLELLMASQAHLGHATSLWHPANQRYIFGIRQGIHIISLEMTAAYLRRAAKIVKAVCAKGGLVLFVGTREGHQRCVVNAAKLAGACHLFQRWVPGSITNGQQILGTCKMKVVDEFDQEIPEMHGFLEDQPVLKPDLVVCLNPLENFILLRECGMNNIPTIGIVDTDCNPTWVTYPIPANDDSMRSVQVIAGVLGKAGEEGQVLRRQMAEEKKNRWEGRSMQESTLARMDPISGRILRVEM